ncbi:MAG TPA: response regulator, partial [Verrucomicrobiae bacterium]
RAHLQRFGLRWGSQAIGKTDFDFFTEEHARQAFDDEQHVIQTGQAITKEEKETWPDGSVSWALSTKMPLRDEDGNIVGTFGISHDITARREAEKAMRDARDVAEQANRTKSQFLANMSHELRTPLNSVIGFAGILLKNRAGNLKPSDLNFLERIQANGKHLLVLINEILDLSKIEARKVELQTAPVALDSLIRETIAQQEGLVRDRSVQLLAEVPAQVAPIETDSDKLRQVIINLIGNALKFTEKGNVTVRIATDAQDRPTRIEVADTGIGIPKEKLGLIFEAFQQADASTARKYGGTGLGLTISQALCRLMGYHIEVTSEVGRGSTFSVILSGPGDSPVTLPKSIPAVETVPAAAPADLRGKTILIIDDEADSRLLLTNMLEEFGCKVLAASSGEQGLRLAREQQPHLITVDLLMPKMDGASVIRELKADPKTRAIPLVVVSIVAEERRGSIIGAVDMLEKPVAREDLLAALRRCLTPPRSKILIVDDQEDAQRILLASLAGEKYEVKTASNGLEALTILDKFPVDLVLLDLMMPVMDGVGFLGAFRADLRYQQTPVIVITSKDLTREETEELKRQTFEVVKKTELSEERFKQLLRRILQIRTENG